MSYEAQLLARAEDLAEVSDLAELVTDILAHVRAARVDTAATTSLARAALTLGESSITVYHAGDGASAFTSDIEFLDAVSAAEDEITDRLRAVTRLQAQVSAALVAARAALLAAQAMPARTSEQQEARQAAIAAAQQRITLCEAAQEVLEELAGQLRQALTRLRAVPADLGEVYESVNELRRAGRVMPKDGDFIEGAPAHPDSARVHPHPDRAAAPDAPATAPGLGGVHPAPLSAPAPTSAPTSAPAKAPAPVSAAGPAPGRARRHDTCRRRPRLPVCRPGHRPGGMAQRHALSHRPRAPLSASLAHPLPCGA